MCTVSVFPATEREGGYDLWFNRDEQRTRAPEFPPVAAVTSSGVDYVAPRDGARGGTWLALNRRGLTVVVLNDYESGGATAGRVSRGGVPLVGIENEHTGQALRSIRSWVDAEGASNFGPFLTVVTDARGECGGIRWTGLEWHEWAVAGFATTSSYAPIPTRLAREAVYAEALRAGPARQSLEDFHWRHDPARGAESVRMSRPDACTRSVCHVQVRAGAEPRLVYQGVDWSVPDGRGKVTEVGW